MTVKAALQLNAVVGLASAVAATAMMSLVLTRPAEVASAVARHEYGAVARAVAAELGGWLHALLRYL
jgi:siroheme synthase